jgi:hypothetical protein
MINDANEQNGRVGLRNLVDLLINGIHEGRDINHFPLKGNFISTIAADDVNPGDIIGRMESGCTMGQSLELEDNTKISLNVENHKGRTIIQIANASTYGTVFCGEVSKRGLEKAKYSLSYCENYRHEELTVPLESPNGCNLNIRGHYLE